jgi:UDP-glucose 4-epimerase
MTQLDRDALDTYLNDHLGASVGALELMERIASAQSGKPLGALMQRLLLEVGEEQEIVRTLLVAHQGSEGKVKQAIAWVGEKLAHVKLSGHDLGSGLPLFEALEALSVGFWGRHELWRGLAHVSTTAPFDSSVDFASLAARARQHLEELEPFRLAAALQALTRAN